MAAGCVLVSTPAAVALDVGGAGTASEPGSASTVRASARTAITVAKLLTLDADDQIFDPGMVWIEDGKITYVGEPIDAPAGFDRMDEEELWAWPGMVDLHSHIHATGWHDTNDMVRPLNPDLRVRPAVDPWEPRLKVATAAGVTTLFGIAGSGTSISGFGVLYKTKVSGGYEGMVVRDPGGMKSAFNFNPQRGSGELGNSWCGLTWTTHHLNDRVANLARREERNGDPRDWEIEDLKQIHRGELPVLIHCASAEGVAGVVRMWKVRYGTNCIVSHGSWDGHLAAKFAAETNTPVNHGPRTMNFTSARREGRIQGGAQSFLDAGVPLFSLNTDSPVIPQEELFLQGSMSARLGADAYQMVRALTTHPAESFLIGDKLGSIEVGKDADIVLSTGDPLDPRCRVEYVIIDGAVQYSRRADGQIF